MHIEQIPYYLTWKIRHNVMYPDQDFTSVILPNDEDGVHFGLFAENKLISVVSTFIHDGDLQFRKFATMEEYQGQGYGTGLLNYLLDYAQEQNVRRVWCNARYYARGFYEKFGFSITDKTYDSGGIAYVIMQKYLSPHAEG